MKSRIQQHNNVVNVASKTRLTKQDKTNIDLQRHRSKSNYHNQQPKSQQQQQPNLHKQNMLRIHKLHRNSHPKPKKPHNNIHTTQINKKTMKICRKRSTNSWYAERMKTEAKRTLPRKEMKAILGGNLGRRENGVWFFVSFCFFFWRTEWK